MIPVNEPLLTGHEFDYVRDCFTKGWISSAGEYVERFERVWAEYCGVRHGIAVSSGTAALQVAVDALNLGPGDEVIIPSFTIISCALAVIRAGATPVLVDCDPATYCIDVDRATAAITSRTRAIMPVHMYGHPADMDPLLDLANQYGLAIIEDSAQAHGCEYLSRRDGNQVWRRCGGLGTVAAFSFYANKLVTTGEGGMVLTDDEALAARCRSLRNLCFQSNRFRHEELGYSFRLSNIQAALGVAQVESMSDTLLRKQGVGACYNTLLASVKGIQLPIKRDWARVNYWVYAIVLGDDVDIDGAAVAAGLRKKGVDTRPFFLGMHEQPALQARGLFNGLRLPVTERLHRRGLYLPSGAALTEDRIEEVVSAVKDVLN